MIIPFYPKHSMKIELVESEWSLVMKMNGHQSERSSKPALNIERQLLNPWPPTSDLTNVNSPVKVNTSHTKNKYHQEWMIDGEAGNICKKIDSADK